MKTTVQAYHRCWLNAIDCRNTAIERKLITPAVAKGVALAMLVLQVALERFRWDHYAWRQLELELDSWLEEAHLQVMRSVTSAKDSIARLATSS